jgi:hypothetical protein
MLTELKRRKGTEEGEDRNRDGLLASDWIKEKLEEEMERE